MLHSCEYLVFSALSETREWDILVSPGWAFRKETLKIMVQIHQNNGTDSSAPLLGSAQDAISYTPNGSIIISSK